jgi:hypothetical protein
MQPIATVNTARQSTTRPFGSAQGRIPRPVLLRRVGPTHPFRDRPSTPPPACDPAPGARRIRKRLSRSSTATPGATDVFALSGPSPAPVSASPSPRQFPTLPSPRSLPRIPFLRAFGAFLPRSLLRAVRRFFRHLFCIPLTSVVESSLASGPAPPGSLSDHCPLCPLHRDTRRKLSFR